MVGGQAVIEGVMMRCGSKIAIAVRQTPDNIVVIKENYLSLSERFPVLKLPVLRGMVAFIESLVLGVRTLSKSADLALQEEEEELKGWELPLTVAFSLMLGVGLFILLPTFLMRFIAGSGPVVSPIILNLGEGVLRLSIFMTYILLISRWSEVERIFGYHGAEHKAIACYEAGCQLTMDNVRPFSPLHPRCGTSFILIVMLVSILLFSFFGWPSLLQRVLTRLLLLPIVAGVSYEAIRWAGRSKSPLVRIISAPGLALQKFTTREPKEDQIEVGIRALRAVMENEGEEEAAAAEGEAGKSEGPSIKEEIPMGKSTAAP